MDGCGSSCSTLSRSLLFFRSASSKSAVSEITDSSGSEAVVFSGAAEVGIDLTRSTVSPKLSVIEVGSVATGLSLGAWLASRS